MVLQDTCEDSTATVNGRQEYHGKGSCGVACYCFKNLTGPEEDLVTSISWNSVDSLDRKETDSERRSNSIGHTPA